jgi:hypothetical protein
MPGHPGNEHCIGSFVPPWVSPVADSCTLLQKRFSNYHLLVDVVGAKEVQV